MKNSKFYICPHCGNISEMVHDTGVSLHCCGEKMTELIPGSVEASGEKHIPAVTVSAAYVDVNVGSVNHPMEPVHWIEWVQLVTDKGIQFLLDGEKPLAVYAYCNLHGLWKTDLN